MAKTWSEVAASEGFKALPPDQQDGARRQYFDDVVAPQVPPEHAEVAWDQFATDTGVGKRALPDGVKPSLAGAGRGSVNPTDKPISLADARPSIPTAPVAMPPSDPMGSGFAETMAVSQPKRESVLEGVQLQPPVFNVDEANRLSNRAYAENTPSINDPRLTAPSLRQSAGIPRSTQATERGQFFEDTSIPVRAAAKAVAGIAQGAGGAVRAIGDVTGIDSLARAGLETAKGADEFQKGMGEITQIDGFGPKSPAPYLANMAEGATSSLAQSAAFASAFGAGAVIPLMSIQSAGQEYDQARKAGLDPSAALEGAIPKGIFEAIGEKFTGLDRVAGAMGTLLTKGASEQAKRTAGDVLVRAGIREVPGEIVTYLGQTGVDLLPGIGLNQNLTMGQFIDGLRDTVVQSAMMGGAMGATGRAVSSEPPAPTPSAEQMMRDRGFLADTLRPTERRKEIANTVDDFAAQHGIPENAVTRAKEAAQNKPLAEVPGFFKRFFGSYGAKIGRTLDDSHFAGLDEHDAALHQPVPENAPPINDLMAMEQDQAQGQEQNATEAPANIDDSATENVAPEWQAFPPESGTLGVPRAEMPQIQSIHRGPLVNYLKARGVEAVQGEIQADQLKPTQAEFNPSKVETAKDFEGDDRAILISSDGHILDGHHQWLAKLQGNQTVKAIQLNAPISELVPLVNSFPSSYRDEASQTPEAAQTDQGPTQAGQAPGVQPTAGSAVDAPVGTKSGNDAFLAAINPFKTQIEDAQRRIDDLKARVITPENEAEVKAEIEFFESRIEPLKGKLTSVAMDFVKANPQFVNDALTGADTNEQNPAPAASGTQAPQTQATQAPTDAGSNDSTAEGLPGAGSGAVQAVVNDAASEHLGKNNTPLTQGGKPYKTNKAARDAKKRQPMMRVVKVEGGYALAPKTEAQIAAQAAAARRLAIPRMGNPGVPMAAHEFIAGEGMLDPSTKSEFGFGDNPRVGNRRLFAGARGGMSLEAATGKLIEAGYLPEGASHSDAINLIGRSVTQPQYTAEGFERMAEADQAQQFEDYQAAQMEAEQSGEDDPFPLPAEVSPESRANRGYDDAHPDIQKEVHALMARAEDSGLDVESILNDIVRKYADSPEAEYHAAAKAALETSLERGGEDSSGPVARHAPTEAQGSDGSQEELAKPAESPAASPSNEGFSTSGDFGPILTQFKGDAQGAIKALTELQNGEAVAALNHPEVGDIDLVWGKEGTKEKDYEDGFGLSKITIKHPEVLRDLQGFLSGLRKDPAQSGANRIKLVDDSGVAMVRLQWDGKQKTWLLTAYKDGVDSAASEGRTGGSTSAESAPPAGQGAESHLSVASPASEGKFTHELSPSGTLRIKGDPTTIRAKLNAGGVTKITPMTGGVVVGKTEALKAKALFEGGKETAQKPDSAQDSSAQSDKDTIKLPDAQDSQQSVRDEALIELRKRMSVLKALRTCLG